MCALVSSALVEMRSVKSLFPSDQRTMNRCISRPRAANTCYQIVRKISIPTVLLRYYGCILENDSSDSAATA